MTPHRDAAFESVHRLLRARSSLVAGGRRPSAGSPAARLGLRPVARPQGALRGRRVRPSALQVLLRDLKAQLPRS